jgi:hypothetical protein
MLTPSAGVLKTQVTIDGANWKITGVTVAELVKDGKSKQFGDPSSFTLTMKRTLRNVWQQI